MVRFYTSRVPPLDSTVIQLVGCGWSGEVVGRLMSLCVPCRVSSRHLDLDLVVFTVLLVSEGSVFSQQS